MGVIASAPAKVMLFGEHFVVYGEPAIVLAMDKRAYAKVELRQDKQLYLRSVNLNLAGYFENGYFKVEQGDGKEAKLKFKPLKLAVEKVLEIYRENVGLDVEVNSTVPVAAGLGSSAAMAAAVTAAVGALLKVKMSKESVFRISYEAEKIYMVDPKYGSDTFTIEYFLQLWARNYEYGLIVIGDPTKDSDGDQLTDSNEIVQNTDPFDTDTDNDGLSDGEEINVYSTDPLEADMFHSFNTSLGYSIGIISNSTIEDFEYFKSNSTIKIHVSDMTANQTCGFCKLAIPHDVMSPPYNVTINDNPIAHTTVYENETLGLSIIYFSYDHSVLEITIVPEFPSLIFMPLFMMATLLVIIMYRKNSKVCQS